MKLAFVKLLTDHEFYEKNKFKLRETMFPDVLSLFHKALVTAHEKYKRTLSLDELREYILATNPVLTRAQRELVDETVSRIKVEEVIGKDIVADILHSVWREEIGREISSIGIDIASGKSGLSDVTKLIEQVGDNFEPDDNVAFTTTNVDEIVAELDARTAWRFNIPSLHNRVPGISQGELSIIFARPEVGKTGAWVSLACAPDGFCWQGARVLALVNEEPAIRTMLRCVNAATGLTKDEIKSDRKTAKFQFDKIAKNLIIVDDVDITMDKLDALIRRLKNIDIVVLDQIDKVSISGSFMRTDEELGATYEQFRAITKRRGVAGIGITQASADAEGKTRLHYSMMAGSKTSKAAEADLILGIGKKEEPDDPVRYISLSKNKISGWHGVVPTMFDTRISTLRE